MEVSELHVALQDLHCKPTLRSLILTMSWHLVPGEARTAAMVATSANGENTQFSDFVEPAGKSLRFMTVGCSENVASAVFTAGMTA